MKKIILSIAVCLSTLIVYSQNGKKGSTSGSTNTKVRSAETGRYVKKEEATTHPKTTVTETTKPAKTSGGSRKK